MLYETRLVVVRKLSEIALLDACLKKKFAILVSAAEWH